MDDERVTDAEFRVLRPTRLAQALEWLAQPAFAIWFFGSVWAWSRLQAITVGGGSLFLAGLFLKAWLENRS